MSKALLLLFLLVFLVPGPDANATDYAGLIQQIETAIHQHFIGAMPGQTFSGAILIAQNGKPLVRQAYGFADHKKRHPNTPETRFMIFSTTKQFTAAGILRLADRKLLNVDDPVSKHAEHWPAEWGQVKLHHLLSHTSGIDVDTLAFWLFRFYPRYWPEPGEPPPYEPKALLAQPGSKFRYSNVGFTVLSLIAEKVSGKTFAAFMKEDVFHPLQMRNTSLEGDASLPERARGHARDSDEYQEQKTIDIAGAGDVVTTLDDLLRWDEALYGTEFLSRSALSAMFTPYSTLDSMFKPYSSGKMGKMGYGWMIEELDGGRIRHFHNGNGSGFRSYVFRRPDLHLYVAILANKDYAALPQIRKLEEQIEHIVESNSRAG